ncbi:MAG TPA: PilZ domain-containing protein [Spirochaetota bacterium]|nr:PilZ domain-containing protein [Spirochaetota bacterium]HOM37978.1 PilZ domain-containing protein [Spirochaetota bacterium]HPQ48783.1 PilZ domain-containing protein [Spirochaetota bacterium]
MAKENERESFRVPLHNVIGEYFYEGTVEKCEIVDISFGGIGIKVNHIMSEGTTIDVRFEVQGYGKIYCKGRITVSRGTRVGVNFTHIPEKSMKIIKKIVEDYTSANIKKMLESKKNK